MTVPKTRSSFPRVDKIEHEILKSAMLDNLHIVPKPRQRTHCGDLADVMFKDLEIKKQNYTASSLNAVVVNPADGREYEVVIIPPKG